MKAFAQRVINTTEQKVWPALLLERNRPAPSVEASRATVEERRAAKEAGAPKLRRVKEEYYIGDPDQEPGKLISLPGSWSGSSI